MDVTPLSDGCLGIWKTEEQESELRKIAGTVLCGDLSDAESPKRRLEKAAVRALLAEMLRYMGVEDSVSILYHDDGRPYMNSSLFISISHTDGYAAVILNRKGRAGVDIEVRSPRALKLVERFESEGASYSDPDSATLCWSAKESVFKLVGKKVADFRETMHIPPFYPTEGGNLTVTLCWDGHYGCRTVGYRVREGFVLTWTY